MTKTDDAIEFVSKGALFEVFTLHKKTILRALTLLKNYEGMERLLRQGIAANSLEMKHQMLCEALDELKSKMEE